MSIETEMFTRLKSVTALSNKVYAGIAPQNVAKPYAVFYKLSPGREYTHEGFADLSETRMQVSVFDTGYKKAKDIATAVMFALEGWANSTPHLAEAVGIGDGTETTFNLSNIPVVAGSITVYLNGTPTTAYTLNLVTGVLVFTVAPGAGVVITADYSEVAIVQAVFIVGEQDMWEQETMLYHVVIDVMAWHDK